MKLDEICDQLTREVIIFIKEWMKISNEPESSFHRYRMKLLDMASKDATNIQNKLLALCVRSGARVQFEVRQVVSDRLIGESTASYIFSRLILGLNDEYMKILEQEVDVIKNESERLKMKIEGMSIRLGVH